MHSAALWRLHSEHMRANQKHSEMHSEALRDEIRGTQTYSEAITCAVTRLRASLPPMIIIGAPRLIASHPPVRGQLARRRGRARERRGRDLRARNLGLEIVRLPLVLERRAKRLLSPLRHTPRRPGRHHRGTRRTGRRRHRRRPGPDERRAMPNEGGNHRSSEALRGTQECKHFVDAPVYTCELDASWSRRRALVVGVSAVMGVGAVMGATCRWPVRMPGGMVPVGKGVERRRGHIRRARRGTFQIRQRHLPQSGALSNAQRRGGAPAASADLATGRSERRRGRFLIALGPLLELAHEICHLPDHRHLPKLEIRRPSEACAIRGHQRPSEAIMSQHHVAKSSRHPIAITLDSCEDHRNQMQ